MQNLIASLRLAQGLTAASAAHDVAEAVALAGRVILPAKLPRERGEPGFARLEGEVPHLILNCDAPEEINLGQP